MWLALLPRIFSLIRTTLNILNGYRIFFISESYWKMAINDGSRQWFLQLTCLLQGKNTPTLSSCSVITHLLVLSSENWSALLWTYKLLHIPSSWHHTSSVGPRLSKNFIFAWEFSRAHHYSHHSALSVWDNLDIPVCIFCKWGARTGSVGLIHPPPCEHAVKLSPQSLLLSALRRSTAVLWKSLSFFAVFSTFVVFIQVFPLYAPHLVLMWCAFKNCINKGCNYCASILGMDI